MKAGALIVSFNPELSLLKKNIEAISKQVESVIVVDNASKNVNEIEQLVNLQGGTIVKNETNVGIASALNIGIKYFSEKGYDFCLTLDQDSICPSDLIKSFSKVFAEKSAEEKIGIICPAINYVGWSNNPFASDSVTAVKACMSSASFTNIEAWKNVGGFDDSFFIDFVDNEFCKKLRLAGYKILRDNSVILEHNLGVCNEIKVLGKFKIRYCLHSPFRYYYMVRNNIAYLKKYHKSENLIKEWIKVLFIILSALIFEKQKRVVSKYIRQGIKDGFNNRMGVYTPTK